MTNRIATHGLQVAAEFHDFIEKQVLPGTGVDTRAFWKGFAAIVHDLAPRNAALLAERDQMQLKLAAGHKANPGAIGNLRQYKAFL